MKKIIGYCISAVFFSLAIVSTGVGLFFLTVFCFEMVNIVFDYGIAVPNIMNDLIVLFASVIVFIACGAIAGFAGKSIYDDYCL